MRALRAFLRPIPDEAIPLVRGSMARGVTTLTLVAAVGAPLSTLATIPGGLADPLRCVLNALFLGVLFLALYLASRTSLGRRHPDWTLLAFVLAAAMAVVLSGWSTRDGVNHIPYFTLFLPAIVAGFAPWRPSLSLALSLPLFAIWYAGQRLMSPVVSSDELSVALMVLPLNSIVAAAANQSHRRLWARLEQTRAELAAAERMYGLGRLTAGIAHELKTPVASTLNSLESARTLASELGESIGHPQVTGEDLRQIVGEIGESLALARQGTERTAAFVHAIREQTRALNEVVCVPVVVASCVDDVAVLLSHRLKQSAVALDTGGVDRALALDCDPGKLAQILTNLIANALDACEESGTGSCIRVAAAPRDQGVAITVEDDGPGVPQELRERVFDPLFTTRTGTGGSGLGLAIARDLAEGAFGGRLTLTALPRGTRFELWCPERGPRPRSQPSWRPALSGQARPGDQDQRASSAPSLARRTVTSV
jgi:signal transduction histidine kinase